MKNRQFEDFSVFVDADNKYFREQNKKGDLKEIKLRVRKPTHEESRESNFIYAKSMNRHLKDGILPQVRLYDIIRENGTWTETQEKEEVKLSKTIGDIRQKLKVGGIKKSEGAKLAKDGIKANFDLINLTMKKNNILNNSAEALAQQDKFNYLTSVCTIYPDNGRAYFENYEEYLRQDNLGNGVCTVAGEKLSNLGYDLDDDFRKDWPEYKFLVKYAFCNDKLQYVNKEGKLVDIDGKLLDEVKPESGVIEDKEPEFLPDDD